MPFDLKTIEALAPDQASLGAAAKLAKRSAWARLEKSEAPPLLWGECQGSGANPYRVAVDAGDHGAKCTCPSRKFPCKHSLALMWIAATEPGSFSPAGAPPEWVNDWLGRRRKGASPAASAVPTAERAKDIGEAQTPVEPAPIEDPAAVERREAAQRRRAEDTRTSIAAALDELDQWIADQLRLGLAGFIDAAGERCRRIAARLTDMKAAALASRLDEIPAHLLALRAEERPEAAIRDLGKLVLLAKAWRAAPDDAELKRTIAAAETREQILAGADMPQVTSTWEVLGEKIKTRRDGLVGHDTWLVDVAAEVPRFAVLRDYYPASAGRRTNAFAAGERFSARLVFYPSRAPLRALVAERLGEATDGRWPDGAGDASGDPLAAHAALQDLVPWATETPLLLPPGSLLKDDRGGIWWRARGETHGIALPLADAVPDPVLGIELRAAAGVWTGARLELLAAQSDAFGRLDLS